MVSFPLDISWKALDSASFHWEHWDEQHAVYDALSGETHLLNTAAALTLERLCEGALPVHELCKEVADRLKRPCDERFQQQISDLIIQFAHLGLVDKCRS